MVCQAKANPMKNLIQRARYTWAVMPRWAKVADSAIVVALVATVLWWVAA